MSPFLHRLIIYSSFLILIGFTVVSLTLLRVAPFRHTDMYLAYRAGCQLASKPLTDTKIAFCDNAARNFELAQISIDAQMDEQTNDSFY